MARRRHKVIAIDDVRQAEADAAIRSAIDGSSAV
jgi:hypothetical protein